MKERVEEAFAAQEQNVESVKLSPDSNQTQNPPSEEENKDVNLERKEKPLDDFNETEIISTQSETQKPSALSPLSLSQIEKPHASSKDTVTNEIPSVDEKTDDFEMKEKPVDNSDKKEIFSTQIETQKPSASLSPITLLEPSEPHTSPLNPDSNLDQDSSSKEESIEINLKREEKLAGDCDKSEIISSQSETLKPLALPSVSLSLTEKPHNSLLDPNSNLNPLREEKTLETNLERKGKSIDDSVQNEIISTQLEAQKPTTSALLHPEKTQTLLLDSVSGLNQNPLTEEKTEDKIPERREKLIDYSEKTEIIPKELPTELETQNLSNTLSSPALLSLEGPATSLPKTADVMFTEIPDSSTHQKSSLKEEIEAGTIERKGKSVDDCDQIEVIKNESPTKSETQEPSALASPPSLSLTEDVSPSKESISSIQENPIVSNLEESNTISPLEKDDLLPPQEPSMSNTLSPMDLNLAHVSIPKSSDMSLLKNSYISPEEKT